MTIAAAVSTNHSCSLTLAKRIKFTPTSACPISTTTKDWISSLTTAILILLCNKNQRLLFTVEYANYIPIHSMIKCIWEVEINNVKPLYIVFHKGRHQTPGGRPKYVSLMLDQVSKKIHRQILLWNCRKVFIKDPTAPHMLRYTTLWNINVRKWTTVAN